MIHPYNGILFSDKKDLSSHENIWMKLKCIELNASSQSETATNI